MEKLYTEKKSPHIDLPFPSVPTPVEKEFIKTIQPGYSRKIELYIDSKSSPLKHLFNRSIKRSVDILLSSIIIITALSWLVPLMAIIISIDSKGPVFFLQKRTGRYGKKFRCIKFRSMVQNEDADRLAEQQNDERITKVGKYIRHYHIDELPQFINVFLGQMSIIGPRPYMILEDKKFESLFQNYHYRNLVKPGITGFAQSNGNFGSTTDIQLLQQRVQFDIAYIQNWSPAMDAKILLRTFRMITQKPAAV